MKKYRLVLADDHQLFMDGISFMLQREIAYDIIGKFNRGTELLTFLDHVDLMPDVLLLDINLPGMDGVEVARKVKVKYPSISVLIVSMNCHISFIKRLLRLNIDGYILKENSHNELIQALNSVVSGQRYFSQEVTHALTDGLSNGGTQVSLTKREYEVLQWVAKGLTTAAISDKLFVSTSTVVSHRKNIMQKLEVKNVAEMIRYATEMGLLE